MKAYFLTENHATKRVFKLNDLVHQDLKAGEVRIAVESFGLNFADVMARQGMYKDAPPLPAILGYEVVGTIVEVHPESRQNLLHKRVLAFTRFGGYSQESIANELAIVEIGDMNFEDALPLATQGCTAWYLCSIAASVRKNDVVLVHAASGGVGNILVQLCKLKGAIVIAKVGSEEKALAASTLGADLVINYKKQDYSEEIEKKFGKNAVDVSFNASAGSTYKKDFRLLSAGGKVVLFGAAELTSGKFGIFSKLNFLRSMGIQLPIGLLMQSKGILGVNMLAIGDKKPALLGIAMNELIQLFKENKLKTIKGVEYNHAALNEALLFLASGTSSGKISIVW